jgi:hypothetical protein
MGYVRMREYVKLRTRGNCGEILFNYYSFLFGMLGNYNYLYIIEDILEWMDRSRGINTVCNA